MPGIVPAVDQILAAKFGKAHHLPVWVQVLPHDGAPLGSAFEVTPAKNHIDALKDVVNAKKPNALKDVDADTLIVQAYDTDTGKWETVTKPWTPLVPNTGETAYRVVMPKPH